MRVSSPFLPWLCVAAFVGLASGAWALTRHAGPGDFAVERNGTGSDALTARMDRQTPALPAPIAAGDDRLSRSPKQPRGEAATPAQQQARMDDFVQRLDRRFMAEPLDAAWATTQERALRQFFDPVALQSRNLATPRRQTLTCHSLTCRVSAQYADAATAELAMQQLTTRLSGPMPYGAVMPKALADGSIEVSAWYSATPFDL